MAINVEIKGLEELNKCLLEMPKNMVNNSIMSAIRRTAKILTNESKNQFNLIKKNKSKTNYSSLNSIFKIEKAKSFFGVKAGIKHREGYKYNFINYGTKNRHYLTKKTKKIHLTGQLNSTNFFEKSIENKQNEINNTIEKNIIIQLNKTVNKYNKNAIN